MSAEATILYDEFENYTSKITALYPWDQWVNMIIPSKNIHNRQAIKYLPSSL